MFLSLVLVSAASAVDSSGPPAVSKPLFPSEKLGNSYGYVGEAEDRGLSVEVWRNETLGREEYWYKPDPQEYYLRMNGTTYVLGVHDGGEWKTDPSRYLLHQGGRWVKWRLEKPGR